MAAYAIQFLWGGAVLAACVGWGAVAARLAGWPGRETGPGAGRGPDWGLRAGWGMALLLVLGGPISLVGLARPWLLIGLVLIGAALFARDLGRRWPVPIESPWWLIALALLPLVVRYAGAVDHRTLSCGDDAIVYFPWVTRLLDTGTLIEPFGFRRLSAYGGQTFLQALVAAVGRPESAYLVDRGVAFVVSFGLVLGFFRTGSRPAAGHWLVAIFLVVLVPIPVLNSSSHHTALALFLTLYRTLMGLAADGPRLPARRLALIGGVAAAAASLKATVMLAAVAAVAGWWLMGASRDWRARGPTAWGDGLRALGHLGLSGLVFLGPWMALMARSSGTPLYPLIPGHHRPEFVATYAGGLSAGETLARLADFLSYPLVALALMPLALYAFQRGNRAGLALYVGALTATVATVTTLVHDDTDTLYRYAAPFLTAAFIASVAYFVGQALREPPATDAGRRGRTLGNAIFAAIVVSLLPVPLYYDVNRVAAELKAVARGPGDDAAYAGMQAAVPPGAKVLVAVDRPYLLDYRRNDIVGIDVPGAASPDPGMPFFAGPAALRDYLRGQSIAYVAFRDFERPGGCLYRRDLWLRKAGEANPMWRAQAKYFLDFFANVEALAATETVVHRRDGLTVLALR